MYMYLSQVSEIQRHRFIFKSLTELTNPEVSLFIHHIVYTIKRILKIDV